jgi:phenylalanyl-tRNA synthetase beta chain
VALIADVCDASIAKGIINEHPNPPEPVSVDVTISQLNNRLGTDFPRETIIEMLESVEFEVKAHESESLQVNVPSFRVDVSRHEDLSEEVARLWGYNNIQTSYPMVPAKGRPLQPVLTLRQEIRQIMTGFSFTEAINYNFISEASCDRLNLESSDKRRTLEYILNPISEQMSVLRSSLIPGLLDTMKKNNAQQTDTLKLFEIGKVFFATQKGQLPEEIEMVAGLITGNRSDQSWYSKKSNVDFFDLKGVVEGLLDALRIDQLSFEKVTDDAAPYFQKGYAAIVSSGGKVIGTMGKIDSQVLKNYGLKQDAFLFDFELNTIEPLIPESIEAQLLPKFPSISRDMTIIVDMHLEVGEILDQLARTTKKEALVESISLFDVYEGKPLADGKKSLSFRVIYRSLTKTLKEKNIKKLHLNISNQMLKAFNAELPE